METKANYLLIGSMVLVAFLGMLGFIIWLVRLDINQQFSEYDILFNESVAGLSQAAEVRFNGIDVGKVTSIRIDRQHPRSARVTIRVQSSTPVNSDAIASLEFQGLTGVAYVQIEGGAVNAPPLQILPGEDRPIIPSKASPLQELFSDVPSLIAEASITLGQIRLLFNGENRAMITNILKNTETVSGGMAARTREMQAVVDNLNVSLKHFDATVQDYDRLATTTNGVMDKDVRGLVTDLRGTTQSVHQLSSQLNDMAEASNGPITAFTTNTLPEVSQLVTNVRQLSETLNRVAERLERNPSEFLFQGKPPEYRPK